MINALKSPGSAESLFLDLKGSTDGLRHWYFQNRHFTHPNPALSKSSSLHPASFHTHTEFISPYTFNLLPSALVKVCLHWQTLTWGKKTPKFHLLLLLAESLICTIFICGPSEHKLSSTSLTKLRQMEQNKGVFLLEGQLEHLLWGHHPGLQLVVAAMVQWFCPLCVSLQISSPNLTLTAPSFLSPYWKALQSLRACQ